MTFRVKVERVCAVCAKPETARRRLVTIPELLQMTPDYPVVWGDDPYARTYCLNRRCVVRGAFEYALAQLKELQKR